MSDVRSASIDFKKASAVFKAVGSIDSDEISNSAIKAVQTIGTTDELLILGDAGLTCAGRALIRNIGENTVELGADGSEYPIQLRVGEFCLTRFNIQSIHAKALIGEGIIEFTITGDDKASTIEPKALQFGATDNGGGEVGDHVALRLGSAQSEVWVTFDLFVPFENLTFWDPNGSANFCTLYDDNMTVAGGSILGAIGQATETGPQGAWYAFGGSSNDEATPGAGIFYDTWITCELHLVKTGTTTVEFYANGSLQCTFTDAEASDVKDIVLGQRNAPDTDATKLVYMRGLAVGTTQGGTDLISTTKAELNAQPVGDAASFMIGEGWTTLVGFPAIVDDPSL
jgi:hypothetical protein